MKTVNTYQPEPTNDVLSNSYVGMAFQRGGNPCKIVNKSGRTVQYKNIRTGAIVTIKVKK